MKRILSAAFFLVILSTCSISVCAQSESRESLLAQIEAKRAELAMLQKEFLAPTDEDRVAYAEFLKQPDTGLTRLLPREVFDKDSKLTVRGGGSYFSFTRRIHEYGWGTQIGLEQNQILTCFAGADYGMIANLGDVPLEDFSLEYPGVKFLASYEAAREEPVARSEYGRFGAGLNIDGTGYKTRLPVVVNNSYVLRGIHYSDSDVLVALRVVRKDTDGSIIILWKQLKKYSKPELARTNQASNAQ
jgi:hypothetical protein